MCSVLGVLTGISGVMQYQGQQAAADAQAKAYENQAAMAERNAQNEKRRQEQIADNYAAQDRKLQQRQRIHAGQVRAAAGAAGISSESGSPLDILSAGWDAYENDKITSLMNQRNENHDSRVTETNFNSQAASYRAAADNTRSVAQAQGLATILGTATAIYGTGAFDTAPAAANTGTFNNTFFSKAGPNTTAMFSPQSGYSFFTTKTFGKSPIKNIFFPYK